MGRSEVDALLQKGEIKSMIIKMLVLLVLLACGMPERHTMVRTSERQIVDSRLLEHMEAFRADCKLYRDDCDSRIATVSSLAVVQSFDPDASVPPDAIGLCLLQLPSVRIEIQAEQLYAPAAYLRAIVYHELAHCAYYLQHVERKGTLISPHIPDRIILKLEWDRLVTELFAEIGAQYAD